VLGFIASTGPGVDVRKMRLNMRGKKAPVPPFGHNYIEPGSTSAKVPPPPAYLRGKAREIWSEVVDEMVYSNTYSSECNWAIATLCMQCAIVAEAHADIALRGVLIPAPRTGTAQVNPMLKILGAASDRVTRLASELGLTAVARDRVKPSPRLRGPSLLARIMPEKAAGPSPASKYLKPT
jgi:P27 family predicted phage terminase small subunit